MMDDKQLDMFTAIRAGEYLIPEGLTPVRCASCGAWMVWTKTKAGKAIPLSLATAEQRDDGRYALTHFADCPEARKWRK